MYIDAYFRRGGDSETIKIVERVNGKRVYKEYAPDYHFFISDPKGTHKSIYGNPVKKVVPRTFTEKQKLLKTLASNSKSWETDVDPIFRCLEQNYRHADAPVLNVAFFDIETSFDQESGWSEASEADNYITSISVYLQWIEEMVCLAVPPETLTWQEAEKIAHRVAENKHAGGDRSTHVLLFKDEKEMLSAFLDLIEDADVLSGWNCIDLNEHVFLEDRIKTLGNISKGDSLGADNVVVEKFLSGKKKKNILRTVFGKTINLSDEHVIPYYIKDKDSYKNLSSLNATLAEGNVAMIKTLMDKNDIYVRQSLRRNTSADLTYGKLCNEIVNNNDFSLNGDDITFNSRVCKSIRGDEVISLDILRLLGYVFTDGFYSNYDNDFSFCGKYKELIDSYINILVKEHLCTSLNVRLSKDGCYYKRFSKNNKFSILKQLIYNAEGKKELNVELLSLLSEEQFLAFISGLVDGDGCIHETHIEICNYQGQIKALETLMTWNGLVTTTSENIIRIKWLKCLEPILSKISIYHPIRKEKINSLKFYEKKNSANKNLNWFLNEDSSEVLVKLSDITETEDYIEMGDIETKTHYFTCNGITVHNSEAYDIPYVVNRIKKVLGKHETRRLCLWEVEPKVREFERGGKVQPTYDLIGRVHADYLQLYKKYNYEERHSYSLNAIAEIELDETKVQYEGTLDELYNDDFEKFLEYNIQDTRLLDRLDKKLQFLDLANSIAHANNVLIQTTMGAVAVTDQAVLIEAHSRGMVCPDKKRDTTDTRAAGGWVASPKKGLHKWIGSTDMKSLYPSVIRAFNMSPETIVGQIRLDRTNDEIALWEAGSSTNTFATWWNDRFNVLEMEDFFNQDIGTRLILDMEDGGSFELTGKELHELIFNSGQPWCISANGTIFRTDIDGVIPGLLSRWYSERKTLQKIMTNYEDIQDNPKIIGVLVPAELFTNEDISDAEIKANPYSENESYKPSKLRDLVEEGHKKRVTQYMNQHNLMVKDGKAIHRNQADLKKIIGFWDKRQLVKKINLNSAYGALLNAGSRFFDQRLGQSTTLSGRSITRHMAGKTNEMIDGEYDHYGRSIVYGDTDSCYFSAYPVLKDEIERGEIVWTKESVIDLYNDLAKAVSATFPEFLNKKFNVPVKRSTGVIASSRETVSESGIWMVKKRYACLMYDKDGIRQDVGGKPGKVKAMGLDLKRADTPKFVQEFLSEILLDTLCGKSEHEVVGKIRKFKEKFEDLKPWQQGTPRAVNKLSFYREKEELHAIKKAKGEAVGGITMPGHVRASLNWNRLKELHRDQHAGRITDGQKIIVCKLRETADNNFTSIAYPVDEVHLPDWFLNLPFASDEMMTSIVDKKVKNLLGVLKWDLSKSNKEHAHLETLFDFG